MNKAMKLVFIVLIIIFPNFFSCSKVTNLNDIVASITGVVSDKATGLPIDSAWIDIANNEPPFSTYTDTTGTYEYSFFIGSGLRTNIFVGKTGYITIDTLIQFSIPQVSLDTVEIFLIPE